MAGTTHLHLVPTPIGNLEDITVRAIKVLEEVDLILAEDTRKSGILLKHYNVSRPLKSYHSFNEHKKVEELVAQLKEGTRMALITDAGTPGISDPGYLLVRACIDHGLNIECLPGASAFIPALVNSGLPMDRFVFEGFLPHKKGRRSRLEKLAEEERTCVLYESPHRLLKTLEELTIHLGDHRAASVSRELTKIHEETVRGGLASLRAAFSEKKIKGEIVIVVAGKGK